MNRAKTPGQLHRLGSGVPPSSLGLDDDVYTDRATGRRYENVNGAWNPLPQDTYTGDFKGVVNGQFVKGSGGAAVWSPIVAGDISGAVNGQFIKGSGGASVWSPINFTDVGGAIADGQLQPRLGNPSTPSPPGNDLNQIAVTGWYRGAGMGNAPSGNWYYVEAQVHDPPAATYQTQTATLLDGDNPTYMWRRGRFGGTWTAWERERSTLRNQFVQGASSVTTTGGDGWGYISFPTAFSNCIIVVANNGDIGAANVVIEMGGFTGSYFAFVAWNPAVGYLVNGAVRVNWIAIGNW